MSSEDNSDGAFKPLIDYARGVADRATSVGRAVGLVAPAPVAKPAPKPDTSWHDESVAAANASFVKAQPTTSHVAGQKRLTSKYGSASSGKGR